MVKGLESAIALANAPRYFSFTQKLTWRIFLVLGW
jgi:hypothetical protein